MKTRYLLLPSRARGSVTKMVPDGLVVVDVYVAWSHFEIMSNSVGSICKKGKTT